MSTPSGQPSDLDGFKPYSAAMLFVSAKKLVNGGYEVISPYRDEPILMGTLEFEAQYKETQLQEESHSIMEAVQYHLNEGKRLMALLENLPKF